LKNSLGYLALALLLLSCNRTNQDIYREMPSLFPPPITVRLNTGEGYRVNPVTGDSIFPLVNSLGDTVITGVPVPARGRVIDPGVVAQAEVFKVGNPAELPAGPGKTRNPITPKVIRINKENLVTFSPGRDTFSFILINSTGDTVPTGIPIPIEGKVARCNQPPPQKALPPRVKEQATRDLKCLDQYMGMNSANVNTTIIESKGTVWIGTHGGGVTRYDGNTFTHYTEKEGLPSNGVRSILEDRRGNIWIGTRGGGVCRYDGHSFTHYTEKEGLSHNDVLYLMEDSKGNIWICSWGGGASKFDGRTITHYTIKEGISYYYTGEYASHNYAEDGNRNAVHSILEDSHGNLWFAIIGGGVCRFDGTTFTHFRTKDGLINELVWYMFEDQDGNMWFTTSYGVSMFDGESFTNFTQQDGLASNSAHAITGDSHGDIWIGFGEGGVSQYNGREFINYTEDEGLSNGIVRSIREDSLGSLWFGMIRGGVCIYQPHSFRHFSDQNLPAAELTESIIEDNNGTVWLNGIFYYNGEYFEDHSGNMGRNRLELQDRKGSWWFNVASGGLSRYDGEDLTCFSESSGLIYRHIYSITEDIKGNFWITTAHEKGICMFDGVTFTHFTEEEGLSSKKINTLKADSKGNIWIGTADRGVSKFDGHCFTHYTEAEGLSNNAVWSVMEDSQGRMWFGTMGGGVNIFDGNSFTCITEKEGLSDNDVRTILEDRDKRIWIGTRRGLNCLLSIPGDTSRAGSGYRPQIHTFQEQDGLNGVSFNEYYGLADSRNRLWWRTDRWVTMLDLNHFKLPSSPPSNLQLNRLDIKGQFIDYGNLPDSVSPMIRFDSVARYYNYPLGLKLPHRLNHLTFYFTAIDWAAPHKIKYSYLIEGIDEDWSLPSSEYMADYRNLPQGTHTLRVRAIGAAQAWGEPFSYTFTIRPPWWFSWWAYLTYGLILISLILLYRRFLLRRAALRSAVEIEKIEKEKVLELDHLKSRFFANISHEFRTPLTLILGPVEGLLKRKEKELVLKREEAGILHRNAKRLLQLINQILDISKLETGKVRLQVSEGDLTEFLRRIVLSFLSLAESRSIKYIYSLPAATATVFFDGDKLEKIVTNLLSNAFKFTPAGGEIKVGLNYQEAGGRDIPSSVEITIRDTGKGIPADQVEKIFDRFYQVGSSDTREYEGTGIGLSLTRELVELYRGKISVASEPEKGSIFTVTIPVSREQFTEEEVTVMETAKSPEEGTLITGFDSDLLSEPEMASVQAQADDPERPVVLIVEDNADLRYYISTNLKEEYHILEAENGRKGYNKAVGEIPDLVITDLMMPEMDGVELCGKIRGDRVTSHIPVIMLTARADKESRLKGLGTGADDYLIKPFDADELRARVANLIRQRRMLREKYQLEFVKSDPFTIKIPDLQDDFMARVLESIQKHLGEHEFGVEELSGEVGFSRSQLHRKLRSLTGFVPNKFIRNIRLKQAARMFREGNTNITQVLYTVGFNSPSRFSRYFREFFGMNPSDFLRKNSPH
jgi:signal transduction histidine kinase/ligand-binding sensor domain-containing protein/DNA-binding response OmpR family regulator